MADITLKIGFDEKEIDKEITTLEKKINSLGDKQLPFVQKLEEIKPKLKQAQAELDKVNKAWAEGKGDYGYGDALKKVQALNAEYDETYQQVTKIDAQLEPLYDKLANVQMNPAGFDQAKSDTDKAAKSVEKLDKEVKSVGNSSKAMGSSFKKSTSSTNNAAADLAKRFDRLKKRIVNLALSALLFSALTRALTKVREAFGKSLMANEQFRTSLQQVKGNLAVAFQPIYEAALPLLNKLMDALKKATAYAAAFVNALFGTSLGASQAGADALYQSITGGTEYDKKIKDRQNQIKALEKQNKSLEKQQQKQRDEIDAQTDALEKQIRTLDRQADALKKSEEAMNAARQARRDALQANIDYIESEKTAVEKAKDAEQEQYDSQIKAVTKQEKAIQRQIKALQKKQKAEEAAAKANEKTLLSFDDINVFSAPEEDTPTESEISALQEQLELLGEQKDAIQEVSDARAEAYDTQLTVFADKISVIQERIDAIQDVDFSDKISAYETQIDSIRDHVQALNDSYVENPLIAQNQEVIDAINEQIDALQAQKEATEQSAAAQQNSLGNIGDAVEEITKKVEAFKKKLEESPLTQWLDDNKENIIQFTEVLGGLAAIVLGVYGAFKLFAGILAILASPAGAIALVAIAIAALVTWAGNGQDMIDNLKLSFKGLKDFLVGAFTGDIKKMLNGLIEMGVGLINSLIIVVESFLQLMCDAGNWVAEQLGELLSYTVPDWVPGIGGKVFDPLFNKQRIQEVNLPRIPVPALATGAVLPANKPFYAMLGDQKNGTNIEAPLETIKQALFEVMQNNQQQPLPPIVAKGELAPLVRYLNLAFEREDKRATAF